MQSFTGAIGMAFVIGGAFMAWYGCKGDEKFVFGIGIWLVACGAYGISMGVCR